jgi:hypothetical protein
VFNIALRMTAADFLAVNQRMPGFRAGPQAKTKRRGSRRAEPGSYAGTGAPSQQNPQDRVSTPFWRLVRFD